MSTWQLNVGGFPLGFDQSFSSPSAFTFVGPERLILVGEGVTSVSVRNLYSRYKVWFSEDDNAKYDEAFSVTGGEPVDASAGVYVTSYFFLQNGWKVRPYEGSHTLSVRDGILLTSDGSDPFVSTVGDYNVRLRYVAPVYTETVLSGSGLSTPQATMLLELYRLMGLDPTKPLVVTASTRDAGAEVAQTIVEAPAGTVTVTRT